MFAKATESLNFWNMEVFQKLCIADVVSQPVKAWANNKYLIT